MQPAEERFPEVDGDWLRQFRRRLRDWHRRHGRSLPWRDECDPYRVWVSEIMLQQTTVAAVVPYYNRFLAAFPSLTQLAAASEQQVLRLWEGLGYYSRARNLHRAAQWLAAHADGRLPDDVESLQQLPGVGRYTAGAIASFGFDRPAAIVEANTLRLYCRLLGYDGDPRSGAGQKRLWAFAEQLVPGQSPGAFNQALIDLGATVCTPESPDCDACPVRSLCTACREHRQQELPRPPQRLTLTDVVECAVIVNRRGRSLLRRCQPGERWAGLWDFPRFSLDGPLAFMPLNGASLRRRALLPFSGPIPAALARHAAEQVERLTGQQVEVTGRLGDLRHGVTRYRIQLVCLTAEHRRGRIPRRNENLRWAGPEDIGELPMSSTGRRLARRVANPRAG